MQTDFTDGDPAALFPFVYAVHYADAGQFIDVVFSSVAEGTLGKSIVLSSASRGCSRRSDQVCSGCRDLSGTRMPIPTGFRLHGIEVTGDGIFELRDARRGHFVDRAEIARVSLGYGFFSERAIAMIVSGALFAIPSLVLAWNAFAGGMGGRTSRLVRAAPIFVAAVGAVLAWEGLRRGVFLRLQTSAGERRVGIARRLGRDEARALLGEARARLGCEVDEASVDVLPG